MRYFNNILIIILVLSNVEKGEREMEDKKKVDFETLEKLALPLHKWLQDNYNPYVSIVVEYDGVKIVESVAFAPLPVRD